jgi:hypothetical protein
MVMVASESAMNSSMGSSSFTTSSELHSSVHSLFPESFLPASILFAGKEADSISMLAVDVTVVSVGNLGLTTVVTSEAVISCVIDSWVSKKCSFVFIQSFTTVFVLDDAGFASSVFTVYTYLGIFS